MLSEILNTFKIQTGYTDAQRPTCLEYINRAAKDLHNSLEADALMREVLLVCETDTQMTLPPFIGDIRGLRQWGGNYTVSLNEIGVPRYTSDTWKYKWRNFTLKGKIPLAQSISNASLLRFDVQGVEETPIIISINGKAVSSHRVTESVTMDAVEKFSINSYDEVYSISCDQPGRLYNVDVYDINGIYLGTLYNNETKTQYILVNISRYAWNCNTQQSQLLMEVLYKTKFYKLYSDTDEFPADGYDDAIAYKAIELWYHGQEGKETDAILFRAKAKEVCDNNTWSAEKGENLKLVHAPNPVYRAYRKMRSNWSWTRGGFWGNRL